MAVTRALKKPENTRVSVVGERGENGVLTKKSGKLAGIPMSARIAIAGRSQNRREKGGATLAAHLKLCLAHDGRAQRGNGPVRREKRAKKRFLKKGVGEQMEMAAPPGEKRRP